ncbi:Pol polyprotein [Elysia marginata]|uniref:Pol polyprotein n=1 Tax=Elysia marginata TaxID=1093978 RepID=A0AAV4EKR6_9GAST|nr:Pol polyprotein [Elysia marginata]
MMRLEPPNKFNFVAEQWSEWAAEFRRFRNASKLSQEDVDTQLDTLIYCMGREANKIFCTFTFEGEQTFDDIMNKFDNYFIVRRNVIYERTNFHERKQKPDETVEEFYRDLRDLAKHCNYQDHESEQIRDRMVVGLKSK